MQKTRPAGIVFQPLSRILLTKNVPGDIMLYTFKRLDGTKVGRVLCSSEKRRMVRAAGGSG